jgi:hypothetical protein
MSGSLSTRLSVPHANASFTNGSTIAVNQAGAHPKTGGVPSICGEQRRGNPGLAKAGGLGIAALAKHVAKMHADASMRRSAGTPELGSAA